MHKVKAINRKYNYLGRLSYGVIGAQQAGEYLMKIAHVTGSHGICTVRSLFRSCGDYERVRVVNALRRHLHGTCHANIETRERPLARARARVLLPTGAKRAKTAMSPINVSRGVERFAITKYRLTRTAGEQHKNDRVRRYCIHTLGTRWI